MVKLYNFSLLITEPTVDWDIASNAFYRAGCADAIFRVSVRASGNKYILEFDREAESLSAAVLSAIENVKSANVGAKVLRVITDQLAGA